MKRSLLVALWGSLAIACTDSASAQDAEREPITTQFAERVWALAFDPNTFFGDELLGPIVTISYTGNDYFWPVFSIAIAEGCLEQTVEELEPPECRSRLTARMVRSPRPDDSDRLRYRGLHLLQMLQERRATSREDIRSRLDVLGVEWMEADLRQCPAAMQLLARSERLDWVPNEVSEPGPRDTIKLLLHTDKVEVMFQQFLQKSIYQGYPAEGTAGQWAVEFYEAIAPCWKPAIASSPWE